MSRFDDGPTGCGCDEGCGTLATFEANEGLDYGNWYKYGKNNLISTMLINNDICVAYINMTFVYKGGMIFDNWRNSIAFQQMHRKFLFYNNNIK